MKKVFFYHSHHHQKQQQQQQGVLYSFLSSTKCKPVESSKVVPSTLTREKEEAQTVLAMFLKKPGLSYAATARTLSKTVCFFDHLVSSFHSISKTRYLVGREFTTLEIRDAHNSYLGNIQKEHGQSLVDIVENLPNLPANERTKHGDSLTDVLENFPNPPKGKRVQPIPQASPIILPLDSKKLKAMARMAKIGTDGQLPSNTLYLMDIGLSMDQIKGMTNKYPSIIHCSVEKKIKPLVEFFLDLGVPPSDVPHILYKVPRLCDLSLSKNIIPSMAYIDTFGLDKSQWVKMIKQFPNLFTYSKQKVEAVIDYMYELGLPSSRIGKCLARCPEIIGLSVDDNLRPTAEYFRSMGVNLTSLLNISPKVFSLSIERKLKPVTEFFLDKGYSIDEIGSMASKFGFMYCFSLTKNLIPKWDFFLTIDYSRSELVKYPHYFGYSLEGRIKPRYSVARECNVKLPFRQLFYSSDSEFEKLLNRMMKKGLDAHLPSTIP